MSNLPFHRPAEWELFRYENEKSQARKKRIEESRKQAGVRTAKDGLNWPQQRWVNQVAPAEMVNPNDFDTFTYRYQVYARPPPAQCDPDSLANVSDQPPPLSYNVKRVAVDRPCAPAKYTTAAECVTLQPWAVRGKSDNHCNCTGNNNSTINNNENNYNSNNNENNNNSNNNSNDHQDVNNNGKHKPGYGTYEIIGGKQYREAPPTLIEDNVQLPPHLAEYKEFTRRCPNYKVGRYDRSDPLNEVLLPGNQTAITIKCSRSPFTYMKNPRRGKLPPLFTNMEDKTQEGEGSLEWAMPSFCLQQNRKAQL